MLVKRCLIIQIELFMSSKIGDGVEQIGKSIHVDATYGVERSKIDWDVERKSKTKIASN